MLWFSFLVSFQAVATPLSVRCGDVYVSIMCAGGFGGGGARGGRFAMATFPTAVGPAQSGVSNQTAIPID